MTLEELIGSDDRRRWAAQPEGDALFEEDALQEADLRDVRYDAFGHRLAILFDLRSSLQFQVSNTAIVVMEGVREFRVAEPKAWCMKWFSRYVIGWVPGTRNGVFFLDILCDDGFKVDASSLAAEFFVGDIPGLPEAPPNFLEDDDATIASGMPAWTSEFEPGWATFLDPAPR